jgi:hypothetical protein
MSKLSRFRGVLTAAFAVAFCLPGILRAQDRDTQEVSSYVLTEAGLAKFVNATGKLAGVPGACDEDDDSGSKSIDQMVAMLNGVPGAQTAVQSAGMTTREYVLFAYSLVQAGIGAYAASKGSGELPAGTSRANVDFYTKHEAEVKQLKGPGECEEDSEDDPDDE